jgi:tetratricopeptide (TPR) repeat protein
MNTPPNMKRHADRIITGVELLNEGREGSRVYVEAGPFDFTELFLTAAEIAELGVIPSLERKPKIARWMPAQRPVIASKLERAKHPLQAVMAAGLAWLSLPGCSTPEEAAPPARTEAVRSAVAPVRPLEARAEVKTVAAPQVAARTPEQARARPAAPRPVTVLGELTMLNEAKAAMDAGHYKAALGIYKHLLYRQPTQVDALFGAALASHELRDAKGSDVYLKRALMLAPNHPLANVLAGFTDQLNHQYEAAREHYGRFLSVEANGDRADEIRAVLASMPTPGGGTATGQR